MFRSDNNILIHQSAKKKPAASQNEFSSKFDYRKWATMLVATFLTSSFTVLCITLIGNPFTSAREENSILPCYINNQVTSVELPQIINKLEWGGKPPAKELKFLRHPLRLVITAHTASPFCSTVSDCSKAVAAIQNYHLQRGNSDITYNFLIGGDGNIYVGRGWDFENAQKPQSITVSFIGNFVNDELSEDMIYATKMLLSKGVELGKLDKNYQIVCHNQTVATISPGRNVFKIVKTWTHYSSDRIF